MGFLEIVLAIQYSKEYNINTNTVVSALQTSEEFTHTINIFLQGYFSVKEYVLLVLWLPDNDTE